MRETTEEFEDHGGGNGAKWALATAVLSMPAGLLCAWLNLDLLMITLPLGSFVGTIGSIAAFVLASPWSSYSPDVVKRVSAILLFFVNGLVFSFLALLLWGLSHGPRLYLFGAG